MPTHAEIHDRIREAKAAASARRMIDDGKITLYWLEFSNPDKSGDDAFMGVSVVPAGRENFLEAVQMAHAFQCNPGGQCAWIEVENLERLPRRMLTRLLDRDEANQALAIIRGVIQ